MADRPLSTPLPADLPENWTTGQTVAPSGADVGLSQQHGYNYLMEQVNAAQRAANAINESFDTISGKRTCRVTMGTSTAGWTQADCDYLCDGTDDQEELNAAIAAVLAKGGGEIAVLGGEYAIAEKIELSDPNASVSIAGEAGATVFTFGSRVGIGIGEEQSGSTVVRLFGITFQPAASLEVSDIFYGYGTVLFDTCTFRNISIGTSYAGDGPRRFVFVNNRVEVDGASGGSPAGLSVLCEHRSNFVISNNVFIVTNRTNNDLQIVNLNAFTYDNLDISNVIFVGNTIKTNGSLGRVFFFSTGPVSVTGNAFSDCKIDLRESLFSNNIVSNGEIDAAPETVVSFNSVMLGRIRAWGNSTVSGNFVKAPDDQPAIIAYKMDVNVQNDSSPCIVGNNIVGGSVGVYLRKDDRLSNTSISKALVCSNRIFGCTTPIQIDDNWSECLVTGNLFPAGSSVVNNGRNNIVRLNSDDPGEGGGGGTAGVSSFNGRAGAVMPQNGDYTAAMVGAIPASTVQSVQAVTQAEYDALAAKDAATLYLIKE